MVLRQKRRKLLRFKRHKLFLILTSPHGPSSTLIVVTSRVYTSLIYGFSFFFSLFIIEIVCNFCMYNFSCTECIRDRALRQRSVPMISFPFFPLPVIRTFGIRRVPLASTILIYALFTIPRAHGALICAPRTEDSEILNS